MKRLILAFLLFTAFPTWATTLSEDFSTGTYRDSGTAVWNQALHAIHPTLQVANWRVLNTDSMSTTDFAVGDGRHGVFDSTTYSKFGTVVGNTIYIDAATFPILQVTQFQLDSPYQLVAVGGPLVIYSLSSVGISGTLLCSGTDAATTTPGTGRCGGGDGGAAGSAQNSGRRGTPQTGNVTAGFGATFVGPASGGGGGGGGSFSAANGNSGNDNTDNPPSNTHGAGGASFFDPGFSSLSGNANGSGGGGGGSGSAAASGGAGGGGGGAIIIHAVGDITVTASGAILARGGNGGASTNGGGGGGGGGGSIQLFTAGKITLTPAGTPVDVTAGSGGTVTGPAAGAGGNGSSGRTWLIYSIFSGAGSESHPSVLNSIGTFQYATGIAQTAISKGYDTQSTLATFQSASVTPTSADIAVQVAGSNDNFVSDDSGWLPLAQVTLLNQKRFVRYKVTLTNSNASNPTEVTNLSVTYSAGQKGDFNFKSSCGLIQSPPPTSGVLIFLLLLQLLPFTIGFGLLRRLKPVKADQ